MRKIGLDELKQTQLEILDVVTKFCDENQIQYWLDAGTLLGAIRHKGYIPWDDDIDIGMLRPDYDKFMRLFNEKNTRYKFHCIENDPKFYTAFGKVLDTETLLYEPDEKSEKLAINIDIFVYDNAPDDDKIVKEMYDRRDFYMNKAHAFMYVHRQPFFRHVEGNFLRRSCVYVFRAILKLTPEIFIPKYYFVRKVIDNSRRYISQDTKRVGNFTSYARITCDKRVFRGFIDVEFEGKKYKAPIGYDEWLRAFYGDYMQLPPVEKRATHHSFMAFKN